MAFKSIRLMTTNLFCIKHNIRLFTTNQEIRPQNDLKTNPKIQKVIQLFNEYDLKSQQMNAILNKIGKYIIEEKELNANVMRDTIDCWLSNLTPPRLRANQLDKANAEDIDYDMSVDFNHVISKIEPKLLLMNSNAIEYRINQIKGLGIIGGSRDLWRVFVYAPEAYYMQSWTDFLKKYHYLNFRVLEWLLDKKDKNNLHPHPLIRNAKVMELSFDAIKCRHLFAERTGLKTVSIVNKLSHIEDMNQIDLKALLLTPLDKYLKLIAPNCSPEEYFALESLISQSEVEDEEQIIEDLVELTTNKKTNFKKSSNKEKKEIIEIIIK